MTRRLPGSAAFAVLLALALLGCSTEAPTLAPGTASAGPGATGASTPGPSPAASTPATASGGPSSVPTCAGTTLAGMTEAQRVGQLIMVGLVADSIPIAYRDAIATSHIGNVWYRRTGTGVAAIRTISDRFQALATVDATAGVPFLIGANQEGGEVQGLTGPGFDTIPSALVQGGWSASLLTSRATTWGQQLLAAGVNTDFAPVSDVVPPGTDSQNAPIGQLDREYGHHPDTVARAVAAFIAGLHAAGVATTSKHFPGLGRVVGNTDSTAVVTDSVTTTTDPYLLPFKRAIASGTEFVMASEATYTLIDPDHLAVFSSVVMRDFLRDQLGFEGVIMSDSLSATAVVYWSPGTRAIHFIEAGGDLIVLNPIDQAVAMAKAMRNRVATNPTFRALVDAAALRVLTMKDRAGLLGCS